MDIRKNTKNVAPDGPKHPPKAKPNSIFFTTLPQLPGSGPTPKGTLPGPPHKLEISNKLPAEWSPKTILQGLSGDFAAMRAI
jgi:hypothetical protein